MRRAAFALTALTCLLISAYAPVFAEECDYYDYTYHTEIIERVYDAQTNSVLGKAPTIDDFRLDWDSTPSFRLNNTLSIGIVVEVNYTQIIRNAPPSYITQRVAISANDFARLRAIAGYANTYIDSESIKYTFIDPVAVLSKDSVEIETPICKNCSSNQIICKKKSECVERGVVPLDIKPECGLYQECVSQYINSATGLCAKSPSILKVEIEKDRQRNLALRRIDDVQTRIRNAVDTGDGVNVSRAQLELERARQAFSDDRYLDVDSLALEAERLLDISIVENKTRKNSTMTLFGVLGVTVIIGVLYFIVRNEKEKQKTEELRQQTLEKETELFIKKLASKDEELVKAEQERDRIISLKEQSQMELQKLREIKDNVDGKKKEIIDIESEIDSRWSNLKPFPDKHARNQLVIINPYLGGYECFYHKDLTLKDYPISTLVHRWVWMKRNNRLPRVGYHIHHIDGNKYNNDPNNLEEIDGEEHYELHRKKK